MERAVTAVGDVLVDVVWVYIAGVAQGDAYLAPHHGVLGQVVYAVQAVLPEVPQGKIRHRLLPNQV